MVWFMIFSAAILCSAFILLYSALKNIISISMENTATPLANNNGAEMNKMMLNFALDKASGIQVYIDLTWVAFLNTFFLNKLKNVLVKWASHEQNMATFKNLLFKWQ